MQLHYMYTRILIIFACAISLISESTLSAQPITANVIGAKVGKKNTTGGEYRSGYEVDENPGVDGRLRKIIPKFPVQAEQHRRLDGDEGAA